MKVINYKDLLPVVMDEVLIEDKWHPLSEGSAAFVPPNAEHQFRNTYDKTFTFVCLIPSGPPEL